MFAEQANQAWIIAQTPDQSREQFRAQVAHTSDPTTISLQVLKEKLEAIDILTQKGNKGQHLSLGLR